MRIFTTISSIFLFCTILFAGEPDERLHNECIYPVIHVTSSLGHGSGVIIRSEKVGKTYRNVFLSCAHLATNSVINYEVKQYLYDEWSQLKSSKTYPALFYAINTEQDLAIGVFISENVMPVAKLDFNPKLFIGNELFKVGCGLGDEPRLDYGKLTYFKKDKESLRTSAFTVPGDSGCPVFHNYKVVGIMVAIRASKSGGQYNSISYAVTLDKFKRWSEDNNNVLNLWESELPTMPFYYLQLKNYEIKK